MKDNNKKSGQGMIEYIILVAIIAVASLGIVRILGNTISKKLAQITLSLQGKQAGKIQDPAVEKRHWQQRGMDDFHESAGP